MTHPKLRVSFKDVSAGWVDVIFAFGSHVFSDSISYLTPIFDDFCDVLSAALDGVGSRPVRLCAESIEYEACFLPIEGSTSIRLIVQEWPDGKRDSLAKAKIIFAMEGSRHEIVVPFWRALRKLQSSSPKESFERRWGFAFPDSALAKLTRRLEVAKADLLDDRVP